MKYTLLALAMLLSGPALAQSVPEINFDSVPDYPKLPKGMNFGEVPGVAVNSRGHVYVFTRSNSANGPAYAPAAAQLLEFDQNGEFVGEIGKGLYGWSFAHTVRIDRDDNIWAVDKGSDMIIKFNPAGRVQWVFGRRKESADEHAGPWGHPEPPLPHADGLFRQPTDVTWDTDGNTYISDGYINSRVAKIDKRGNWVKSWGSKGSGGPHADENPGQFNTPHNIAIDRQNNVYVADRGNRRIQVFDTDGKFLRMIHLNVPYDKKRHPVLGNMPASPPDETAPWTLCINTTGPTQYLYTTDQEPGRLYKLSLDGTILGMLGESGRDARQFNWIHGLACPSEDVIFVADMNNWRVQKLTLHAGQK
jgi:NHL repeat